MTNALTLFRNVGYRDNCELSDLGEWDVRENDFDFDNQWDYFAVGSGGGNSGGCLDGNSLQSVT